MADIPAANVVKQSYNVIGNQVLVVYKVTGDGSGVTIPTHVGRIVSAWVGNSTETAGYSPQISFSGNTITYAAAPTSSKIHYLHVLGTA